MIYRYIHIYLIYLSKPPLADLYGANSVAVNDLSAFGSAININSFLGQICNP